MDSGNSGSMQSSSGGDEEYDSRSESISAFKNNSSDHIINQQQQQPIFSSLHHLNHTHHQTSTLDPMSNFLDPFSRSPPSPNQNPHLNFDMVWPRGLRSEPNCTDTVGFMGSSSSSSSQLMLGSHHQHHQDYSGRTTPLPNPAASSISSLPHQPPENGARDHHHQAINNNTTRNSKKRSRASRRAPTTVLTTDTSNFRAMVQEFTGIPAPPFSMASPFSRTRLDLFRTPTTMRSGHLESTPSGAPPYLLRPFAHKIQPPSYLSSSHSFSSSVMADGIVNSTTSNNTNTPINNAASTNSTSAPSNFASTSNFHGQLLSDQPGLAKHTQNLLNMQHPVLTLQSLLNTSPPPPTAATNYSLPNVPNNISSTTATTATVKSQGSVAVLSNDIPHLKMGLLEELDMNHHGHVGADQIGGLPMNLVVSEGTPVSNNTSSRWGDGIGLMHDGNDPVPQRSFSANYGHSSLVQQANGCSSSDFHAERASDQNISSRGEGMVDSWICSSD